MSNYLILFFCIIQLPLLLFSTPSSAYTPEEPLRLSPGDYTGHPVISTEKKILLTDNEKAWLKSHKTIRLAFDGHFPPYSFLNDNGEFEGLAVDVMRIMANRAGINIELSPHVRWKELYRAAQNREADVVATMVKRPEREQWFVFTRPYIFKSLVITTRKDYTEIHQREDLAGKTVALVNEYQYVQQILEEYPSVKPYYVDKMLDALIAVSTGKADATITHLGGGHYLRTKFLLTNLRFASIYDRDTSLERFAVRKDWPELASILDKALDSISEEEMLTLQKKWLPVEYLQKVTLTDKEKQWIQAHPVIRLGIDPEFAPFEYITEDGVYSGIASDYINTLNTRLGLNMQIVPGLSWQETVEKARTGEIDVLPCVGISRERETFLSYSKPYINFHRVIITRTEAPFFTDLEDVRNLKIAVQVNTSHEGYLKDKTDIVPISYKTLQESLLAVSHGKADVMVGNIASSSYWIRKLNLTNLKVAAPVSPELQSLHFAVRKDWPELLSIINKGLESIAPEEQTKIRRRWVAVDYKPGIAPGIVQKYAGIALVLVGLILAWSYGLKREILKRRKTEEKLQEARDKLEERVRERTTELVHANKELHTINEIIAACTGTLNQNEILNIALDAALGLVNLEGGTICLISPDNTFHLAAHRGTSLETIDDLTTNEVKIGECLCGNCAKDCKPLILQNRSEVMEYASREAQRGEDIRFHAAFPIAIKDKPLGVLCVFTRTDKKPGPKSLKLLETMTSQISLTIENASLYEETLRNAETLERKVKERTVDLENANIQLKELDKLKSMFIASMSHELRTPLNSIIGFTGMTLQGLSGDINDEQKDNLGRAYASAKHLLNLITDVIDISKVEAGRIEVLPESFELGGLVDDAINNIEPQRKEKGLELEVDVQSNLHLHTDKKRLLQCLVNFLSNAVKYSETGTITISSEEVNGNVELSVHDTGIGIAEEDIPKLFEAFERLQTHLRVKAGGTGLGLYLTRKLAAEILHGTISVRSTRGTGSTFTLTIPKDISLVQSDREKGDGDTL